VWAVRPGSRDLEERCVPTGETSIQHPSCEEANAVLHELAHAIPDWLLVSLAGIGALCLLSTAALALAIAGLNKVARQRVAKQQRGGAGLEEVCSRERIVGPGHRLGEKESTPITLPDREGVAPP
jgi:hypothetical protein